MTALRAVLIDLDDTLYPQASWLAGAWDAVVAAADRTVDVDPLVLRRALHAEAARGSARGGIIDRALAAAGVRDADGAVLVSLVAAFRAHQPAHLEPFPGVPHGLRLLVGAGLRLALVSDGHVAGQRAKLAATGLCSWFDAVVWSDEHGRELRKPHRAPYERALGLLGVDAREAAFIGDNPRTDIPGADALGMWTVRVRTGEYAEHEDVVAPGSTATSFADAAMFVSERAAARRKATARC